jgi:hypothetical protein
MVVVCRAYPLTGAVGLGAGPGTGAGLGAGTPLEDGGAPVGAEVGAGTDGVVPFGEGAVPLGEGVVAGGLGAVGGLGALGVERERIAKNATMPAITSAIPRPAKIALLDISSHLYRKNASTCRSVLDLFLIRCSRQSF